MFSGQVVEALATVIKKEKEEDEDNKGEFKFFKCSGHFVRSFMFLMSSDSSLQWIIISQILSLNFRFHHFELDF